MSVNDTDEWASMIINEICEEAKAFEKISLGSSADNKDVKGKRKSIKISDRNTDFTRSVSENSKDQLVDFPHSYQEKMEKNDLIFNTSKNISDGFYKIDDDITARINEDQDIFANGQNVTPDFKSNIEMIKMTNVKDVSADSAGKPIDREAKSDIASMSKSETENSKEKKFVDLNEAFLLDSEMNSRKTEETVKTVEISFSSESVNGSTKDFSKMSHVKSDISDSFSLRDSYLSYDDKKNKFCFINDDDLSEKFSDKFYLHNHNTDFQVQMVENNCDLYQFRDKAEIQTNNLLSVDANLKPAVGFSQDECLNRLDKKIKLTGFRNLQKEKSKSAKLTESQSDLYFQWFKENYIIEETKCHLNPTDKFVGKDILAVNCSKTVSSTDFKNLSVIQNANKTAKNVDVVDEVRKNWDINNKVILDENTDGTQKIINVNNIERKFKFVSGNDITTQKSLEIDGYSGGWGDHQICNMESNPMENIFDVDQISEGKQLNEIADDKNEMDGEEQETRNQRETFVVHRYREICLNFEILFIRPFANVIADSYELLIFVFCLIICIFVFLYDRVQFLIRNYVLMNVKKPLNNSAYENANVAMNTEETTKSAIALDRTSIHEDTFSEIKEATTVKLSPEKSTNNEMHRNLISWVHVEPEEINVICMNCECVTENVTNLYEKVENYLTVFCNTEQYRATIKVNSDIVAVFEFINNDDDNHESKLQLPENDFDMEIIASSKSYGMKEIDSHEIHKSYDIEEFPKQNKDSSEINSLIMRNSNSFFTKLLPGTSHGDEKPLFNSTEVDGFETESMSKHRCCSDFDVLSALYVDEDDCFKSQVCPRHSSEERCLNSSLSVNLPSFCWRSGILSESARLLKNSEGVSDNECINSVDCIKILKEMKREQRDSLLSSNLCVSKTKVSQNTSIFYAKNSLKKEEDENSIESVNDTSKNLGENSHMVRHNSGFFSVSDIADVYFQHNSHHSKNSFMCGDAKFISCFSNPSNQFDLSMKAETVSNEVKDNLKKENNMRCRISSILDNWKNMQVMSACMRNRLKSKKKCTRNDVTKRK